MSPRITLEEIAKRAGVHRTTVSLALRNSPALPHPTRERLQSLAEKMGYRPDPMLRALVEYHGKPGTPRRPPTLGYLTFWDTALGWRHSRSQREFFEGAAEQAEQLGFHLEHFWLGAHEFADGKINDALLARGIRGLVLASHLTHAPALNEIDWAKFCAVKIDYCPHQLGLHRVTNDQHSIMRLAMQRAREAGYRRIGLVMPRWWDEIVDFSWSGGFLTEHQFIEPEDRVPILWFSSPPTVDQVQVRHREQRVSRSAFKTWFENYQPDVLISRGVFVEEALTELAIAVPEDLAFIDMFLEPDGKTAGVLHNCRRVGEVAIERIVAQLQENHFGLPEYSTATLVEGTWIDGASLPTRSGGEAGSREKVFTNL